MQTCKTILSKIISFLLICIFAAGITPVSFVHNLFAGHIDTKIWHNHKKNNEVAKAGFDCHTENFVAESNFLSPSIHPANEKIASFPSFSNDYKRSFYSKHHFYAELRGPPVMI